MRCDHIQNAHVRVVWSWFEVLMRLGNHSISEIMQTNQACCDEHPPPSACGLKFLQILSLMHVSLAEDKSFRRFCRKRCDNVHLQTVSVVLPIRT
jgi:hypothetical protein